LQLKCLTRIGKHHHGNQSVRFKPAIESAGCSGPIDQILSGPTASTCRRENSATKQLAKATVAELTAKNEPALAHDSSTNALIRRYRQLRDAGA
jgi:hypothetical protein